MVSSFLGGMAGGASVNILINAIDNYSKEFNKLNSSIKKQQSIFKKLGTFLKSTGLGYAAVAGAAVSFGVDSVKAALKAETAFQSFNLVVGDSADEMLKSMKRASKGMISDLGLVENANRALALGIKKSDIPGLLEVATARSKVFGRTATEAFEDLSIGIGRQSRMILDNLGIILDLDKVYKDYAETLGITAEEVKNLYSKEALTNAIIEESKGLVQAQNFLLETHDEKLQKVSAGWDNFKRAVGESIVEFSDSITGIEAQEEAFKSQIDTITGVKGSYDEIAEKIVQLQQAQKDLTDEYKASKNQVDKYIDSLLNLKDITFEGERGKNIEVVKQKEVIRQLQLRELAGENVESQLESEQDKLEKLRLEQEGYDLQREIQQAQNALNLENIGQLNSINQEEFKKDQAGKFILIDQELKKQDDIQKKLNEVNDLQINLLNPFEKTIQDKLTGYQEEENAIDDVIQKTNDLIKKYDEAARARESAGVSLTDAEVKKAGIAGAARSVLSTVTKMIPGYGGANKITSMFNKSVNDAIISPTGNIITTDPEDYLIATKNPQSLSGGGGVTIVIENLVANDAQSVANVLQEVLRDKISL